MYVEILIIGILVFTILTVNGYVKPNKFIYDNQDLFMKLKEADYDLLNMVMVLMRMFYIKKELKMD